MQIKDLKKAVVLSFQTSFKDYVMLQPVGYVNQ